MRDGLFKRYITTFGVTLLTCTVLLGIALLYFSARNFTEGRQQILHTASERAVGIAMENYILEEDGTEVVSSVVYEGFKSIYDASGVNVFMTDPSGVVITCSEGVECTHTSAVSERMLTAAIKKGSYSSAGYFEGFFQQQGSYTYGVPLWAACGGGQEIAGFIFVSTPITPLMSHLSDMALTFLISAGVMLLVAAGIIYFATRKLIKPLSEISSAARRFGSGDFSARVTVAGSDEIANVGNSFNLMADSLTEYEMQRRDFVANVSHELRTPMTTISGYIDGILDSTIPREKEGHYLMIVSDEIKRLSRLSTSLLNMSRIEEGVYAAELSCANVWDVVIAAMTGMERRISEKGIEVPDLDATPRFAVYDHDMLHQIIYNLLDNAIKFTPEGGTIEVTAEAKNGQVHIAVRNTGSGIPPDELNHIFERFYKTDKSRGLDRMGTGLGLYIARTLALKMDAELTAQSEQGSWAQFTLVLPAGTPDKKQLKEARAQSVRVSGQTKEKQPEKKGASWLKKWGGFRMF